MALRSIDDLLRDKSLTPNSEVERINAIVSNRRFYNGNFVTLRVGDIEENIPGLKVNWFRRVAQFYPQFMLAERPTITIEGNARFTGLIEDMSRPLWRTIQSANVDVIRFGYGVVASHPDDPTAIWTVEPDSHYVVQDNLGEITADILVRVRDAGTAHAAIDFYIYGVDGSAERRVYRYEAGVIGELLQTISLPIRGEVRQVVEIPLNATRVSVYDDIRDSVAEISRSLTGLARTIRRNAHPHLYGPDAMLAVDENGRAELNVEGMFLPLQPDSQVPGYLQWDSKHEAVGADIQHNTDTIFAMTGLSRVLFEPDTLTGVASGIALRRLLLPFVSWLNDLKEINAGAVEEVLNIINLNGAAAGGELYAYTPSDISIEFPFERIFTDDQEESGERDIEGTANSR